MNNKRGGAGAKFLLILILMIASAAGGAYGYTVYIDGWSAVRDAKKAVEDVDVSDYDTAEQTIIQGYIDDANKELEQAKTRKDVYEILGDFISDVEKVKTKTEKDLEEALKAAEEAKNNNRGTGASDTATGNNTDTDADGQGSYKSNTLDVGGDESEEDSGFLNSLLGGMKSGAKKE